MLTEAGIRLPANLAFVPLDLEHKTLAEELAEAGFDDRRSAFFGWLGVVPYLTLDAFRATLSTVAQLPAGSAVSFDYVFSPDSLPPPRRKVFDGLAQRLAAAGEPIQLFFTSQELESELRRAGFKRVEQVGIEQLNEIYFKSRADGLKLSPSGVGTLATAWV
jgi:methyltransferase (TIGR00027 family)